MLLTVVTVVYVIITNKILQVPNQSIIRPTPKNNDDWIINIKNYGPGMAINIKVKTILSNSNYGEILTREQIDRTEHIITAKGNQELLASNEGSYSFNSQEFRYLLAYPLIIEWQTITGRKNKTVSWLYSGDQDGDYFIKVGLQKRIKLEIKIWKIYLSSIQKKLSYYKVRTQKRRLENMAGQNRSELHYGLTVDVILKNDQRTGILTRGKIDKLLTNSSHHPHGIKVKLQDGQVGRVQAIIGDDSTNG